MITKAIVQSINANGTRCIVRMPLFETASSTSRIEAEALVSVSPGVFNGLVVGDIVFVTFEENALEKPIIIGKLFKGANTEGNIRGGGGIFNTLKVNSAATIPSSTLFVFPQGKQNDYKDLKTPKKMADYIKWLENFTKKNINQLDEHFRCFKNWTQWQLKAENVEVDDGDLDEQAIPEPFLYQEERKDCRLCDICTKKNARNYSKLTTDTNYPNI